MGTQLVGLLWRFSFHSLARAGRGTVHRLTEKQLSGNMAK